VRLSKWLGLNTTASPYLLPAGGAVEQVNIQSLVPGQLTVRGGMSRQARTRRYTELWGLSVGSGKTDVMLGCDETGSIYELSGIGGTVTELLRQSNWFLPDRPVSFSQGRRGEVYIYQGYGKRGLIRSPDGSVRPVGLDAPEDKPAISIDTSANYYVARIDITDAGNGYHVPPSVFIGPPPAGGRQATAVARIANAQVSEVEVTDGGSGYATAPCVQFTDTPNGPATGSGAVAKIELEDGAAKGDYETGIVYWEISELPTWFWLCLDEYQKEGGGYIVPAEGGSGTGAKAIFWFEGLNGSNCYKQNSDGTELTNFGVRVQVYDFGQGYEPGDVVVATLHTAGAFQSGFGFNGPRCDTTQQCQVRAEGLPLYSPKAPDRLTIIDASPYKHRRIKPTLASPGSGYLTPPTFVTEDGDIIRTEVDCSGSVTKLILDEPNKVYLWPPSILDPDGDVGKARGLAIIRPNFRGKYQCYYRYINENVPEPDGGPLYSSLSPLHEVDAGDGASSITWTLPALPAGATGIELWRSSSNQAITLFKVATLTTETTFADSLSDYDLTNPDREGFLAMPILLADGSLNANRFGVASTDFAVGVVFQDRTFLAVDTTGKRPNTLLYSEADEPEAVPEVNELILQTNVRDTDYITALIPYAGALIVAQSRHCHRLAFVRSPALDATTSLIAYRGCLNQRCWDLYDGVAYILDDNGLYSMDQQGSVEPLTMGLDNLFQRTNSTLKIDFSKRQWFFVRADRSQGVIRVHVAFQGDAGKYPTSQIVYCPNYKTFWIERYPEDFSSATNVRSEDGGIIQVHGGQTGLFVLGQGLTDDGEPIEYSIRTGNFEFLTDSDRNGGQGNSRQISVVYTPTQSECRLNLSVYYNGSATPRGNVVRRDRGTGFIHDDEVPAAYVDMQREPHEDAETNGVARALFVGKTLEDFGGADTHVSVQLWGKQDESGPVSIHSVDLAGVSMPSE